MLTISKNEIAKRWDVIPQTLRDALWSEYNADVLWEICKKEHLSEEKTSDVATLAGDVIMGFLLPEDLSKEIAEAVEINQEIADRVAAEIEKKIFRPITDEIKEVYSPPTDRDEDTELAVRIVEKTGLNIKVPPATKKVVGAKPLETELRTAKSPVAETTPVAGPKKSEQGSQEDATPFVLHQEEQQQSVAEGDKFKGIDLPFGFFGEKEKGTGSSGPVRVKVETPGAEPKRPRRTPSAGGGLFKGFSKKKDDGNRVVHYSEYRTPLTPFGKPEEDIISLQNFAKEGPPPTKAEQPTITPRPDTNKKEVPRTSEAQKPPTPVSKPAVPEKKEVKKPGKNTKGPSIEGNIVDLKNL